MDINKHKVLYDGYMALGAIEACGASEELTTAVVAVSDVLDEVEKLVDKLQAVERLVRDADGEVACQADLGVTNLRTELEEVLGIEP